MTILKLSENNMIEHFLKPSIICVCGDINTCKSNLLYHLIKEFRKSTRFKTPFVVTKAI